MLRLHFYGGAGVVTGVNYLLEIDKTKILIDCGLFQGRPEIEERNYQDFPYSAKEIDFVLITHAHLDHIGRLPQLVKAGFKGKIFATEPTKDFAEYMLLDSEEINAEKSRRLHKKNLYSVKDIERTLSLFEGIGYKQKIKLAKDIHFQFRDAGHILGSAIIELWAEGRKIVFSGDLGNPPVPLLRPTEYIEEADYVLIESTYGDRIHETKHQRRDLLEDAIEDTVAQAGTLLIPSFALERTQEILYELNCLVENHRIPRVPIFIDSPLAIDLTQIYRRYPQYFNQEATYLIQSGDDLFKFPGLRMTSTVEESKQINQVRPPKIIIAGSGMSTGGRILHHEKLYLPDPRNTFLVVCYQVEGTLGREILDGAKEVEILGEKVPVRCRIKVIPGYSAHADQNDLCFWVRQMKNSLKKVFVVQGEEKPAQALAQKIKDHLGLPAVVPHLDEVVDLE